jgi:hypothetical protein
MSNGGKAVPLNLPEWAGCRMDEDFVGGKELWVDQPRHRAGSLPTPRMQPTGRSGAKVLAGGTRRWRRYGSVGLCGRGPRWPAADAHVVRRTPTSNY